MWLATPTDLRLLDLYDVHITYLRERWRIDTYTLQMQVPAPLAWHETPEAQRWWGRAEIGVVVVVVGVLAVGMVQGIGMRP
jgi:hypothetical protein